MMKLNTILFPCTFLVLVLIGCGQHSEEGHGHHHGHANAHMNQSSFEDLATRFEDPSRAEWQKPQEVVALFGDLNGKTVMDIGSGTGYFAFPLAEAGAKVIAADVDDRFQEFIKKKKEELGIGDSVVELRKIPYDSPSLSEGEVDEVIIVNTYHHIENRKEYFGEVLKGLKEGGRLWVVDYVKKETPNGPPVEMRMSAETVQKELVEAGYQEFELNETLLPYQYILIAK